jgi:adenylate cyclase
MSTDKPPQRERRLAAALYADISGSTALTQAGDLEGAHDIMEKSIKSLQRAALDHGAAVVNLRGDAIVALFGIPTALEDATRAAVNTAIDIDLSRRS